MGEHRNRGVVDALSGLTVLFTGTLSVILVVVTLAGR